MLLSSHSRIEGDLGAPSHQLRELGVQPALRLLCLLVLGSVVGRLCDGLNQAQREVAELLCHVSGKLLLGGDDGDLFGIVTGPDRLRSHGELPGLKQCLHQCVELGQVGFGIGGELLA